MKFLAQAYFLTHYQRVQSFINVKYVIPLDFNDKGFHLVVVNKENIVEFFTWNENQKIFIVDRGMLRIISYIFLISIYI